jgi:hypothetical protein
MTSEEAVGACFAAPEAEEACAWGEGDGVTGGDCESARGRQARRCVNCTLRHAPCARRGRRWTPARARDDVRAFPVTALFRGPAKNAPPRPPSPRACASRRAQRTTPTVHRHQNLHPGQGQGPWGPYAWGPRSFQYGRGENCQVSNLSFAVTTHARVPPPSPFPRFHHRGPTCACLTRMGTRLGLRPPHSLPFPKAKGPSDRELDLF